MITTLRTMLTCHWSARRIQRYLDADPSAQLLPDQLHRLEFHLAACQKCADAAADYRGVRRTLQLFSQRRALDPEVLRRVRARAEQLLDRDAR